jgi:hypothetical protein
MFLVRPAICRPFTFVNYYNLIISTIMKLPFIRHIFGRRHFYRFMAAVGGYNSPHALLCGSLQHLQLLSFDYNAPYEPRRHRLMRFVPS